MSTRDKKTEKSLRSLQKIHGKKLTLGRLLWAIRVGDEINQIEFGRLLGDISKQQVCDIEHGRKLVSPRLAAKYAKLLGYPEQQFIELSLQDMLNKEGLDMDVYVDTKKPFKTRRFNMKYASG